MHILALTYLSLSHYMETKVRKYFGIFLILLLPIYPNFSRASDSINVHPKFCGIELSVPNGCEYNETKISKGLQFVQWFNDSDKSPVVRDQLSILFLNELQKMLEDKFYVYKKTSRTINVLNEEINGYIFYVRNGKDKRYYIVALGMFKTEHVRIYASTSKNPVKKKNLPDFIRQLFYIK